MCGPFTRPADRLRKRVKVEKRSAGELVAVRADSCKRDAITAEAPTKDFMRRDQSEAGEAGPPNVELNALATDPHRGAERAAVGNVVRHWDVVEGAVIGDCSPVRAKGTPGHAGSIPTGEGGGRSREGKR